MQTRHSSLRPQSCDTSVAALKRAIPYVFSAVLATSWIGCRRAEPVRMAPGLLEVEVTTVDARDVPIVREWMGTLDGYVNAEIRGQVTGYLLRQAYREGSFVRNGEPLFEIDPRPFEAALREANGRLAQAQSSVHQAESNLAQN